MRIWNTLAAWRTHRRTHRRTLEGALGVVPTMGVVPTIGAVPTMGVVPTMGALHRGHAALVERCRAENDLTVVTIFVNPTQFNDPNDLARYPRPLAADLALLESLGVTDVLAPRPADLYPENAPRLRVIPNPSHRIMEGLSRPGYLEGVLTVVLKLLNIVAAQRAYFGEKDYQQLRAIDEMARDFFLPTEIVACPTVRTAEGLAESSRNALLSPDARARAARLYSALTAGATAAEVRLTLEHHGFTVDYVEEHWGRRLAAATLDGVRLIDNVPLTSVSIQRTEPCS